MRPSIFKDSRFNGWIIGEVYVCDQELIPNARRDDFEHNDAYFILVEQLRLMAAEITREIRSASIKRNKALEEVITDVDTIETRIDQALETENLKPATKGQITSKIIRARSALENAKTAELDQEIKQSALEKLDILTGRIQGAASFKSINLLPGLTKVERLLLERIFIGLLEKNSEEEAEKYIEAILSTLR